MTDTYQRPPQRAPSPGCDVDPWHVENAQAAAEWLARQPRVTMSKVIRSKCRDCSGGSSPEVRRCQVFDCPLWRYRFGSYPESVAKRHPERLDPVQVMIDGFKAGLREIGKREWINPLTGQTEPLLPDADSEG